MKRVEKSDYIFMLQPKLKEILIKIVQNEINEGFTLVESLGWGIKLVDKILIEITDEMIDQEIEGQYGIKEN